MELPYDPAISLLGIYPKKYKTLIQKDTCTHIVIVWVQSEGPLKIGENPPTTLGWEKREVDDIAFKILCITTAS